jgi:tetratricopeptide (TPR) repeat protein
MIARDLAALAASLLLASSIVRPAAAQEPARPKLAAAADTNDWEAYYDAGIELLRLRQQIDAERHFYWASRLDPSRAEPYYARWVAFWARDPQRYLRWWEGARDVVEAKDVRRADSLRTLAEWRNPLVYQGIRLAILDQLPGDWADDPLTRALVAYGRHQFDRAAGTLQNYIARNPSKHAWARYYRALVLTAQEKYDSATTEMQSLVTELRSRDAQRVEYEYYSKAFPEYAIGRLLAARGDLPGATEAFGRSLAEDIAYAPSHQWLAQVALARGDVESGVRELEQAVELSGGDGVMRWELGRALGAAGRDTAALEQLQAAVRAEPHFADPYFSLALALDRIGRTDEAVAAYRDYLARATRKAPNAARARARLEQLTRGGT